MFLVSFAFSLVSSQVLITKPAWLRDLFAHDGIAGSITASTATFGSPSYGGKFVGVLKYAEPVNATAPHCSRAGYKDSKQFMHSVNPTGGEFGHTDPTVEFRRTHPTDRRSEPESENQTVTRSPVVVVVQSGGCSFVSKVRVAQSMGADAVIVVDAHDSKITSETIHSYITGGLRYGKTVKIPSMLISKEDGEKLIRGIRKSHAEDVDPTLELRLDVPTKDAVVMDLWMTSASPQANAFLKDFKNVALSLGPKLHFVPHYSIYEMHDALDGECLDEDHRYCNSNSADGTKGRVVVAEDLRQLCLWLSPSNASKIYWDYVSILHERCPLEGTRKDGQFGSKVCSGKVMREVGAIVNEVDDCMKTHKKVLLDTQVAHAAWGPFALGINGWSFGGEIESSVVTKVLCNAFNTRPAGCDSGFSSGFQWHRIILMVVIVALFATTCGALWRLIKSRLRTASEKNSLIDEVSPCSYGFLDD